MEAEEYVNRIFDNLKDSASDCEKCSNDDLCERHQACRDLILWSFMNSEDGDSEANHSITKICMHCGSGFYTCRITQMKCLGCFDEVLRI